MFIVIANLNYYLLLSFLILYCLLALKDHLIINLNHSDLQLLNRGLFIRLFNHRHHLGLVILPQQGVLSIVGNGGILGRMKAQLVGQPFIFSKQSFFLFIFFTLEYILCFVWRLFLLPFFQFFAFSFIL